MSEQNTAAIKSYIVSQLKQDQESDQLTLFEPRDPFTVASNPTRGW